MNEYNKNLYFHRVASIRIGRSSETGFVAHGLRVEFSITKTTKSDSNKCELTIYNLSKLYSSRITVNDGMIVELMVGYSNAVTLDLIFLGDVISITQDEQNPDKSITLELEDGGLLIRKKFLTISLSSNATLKDVFNLVLSNDIGNYQKSIIAKLPNITLKSGIAFAGYFSDLLNKICKAYNLEWSIQNGILQVNEYFGYVNTNPISIRALQIPKRIYLNKSKEEDDSNFNGYEIRCLLQPKIVPGGIITMEGTKYKVMNVKHTGDTHGETWESVITTRDLKNGT